MVPELCRVGKSWVVVILTWHQMGCDLDGWDSKQKNGKPLREIIRLDGKRARSWGGDENSTEMGPEPDGT